MFGENAVVGLSMSGGSSKGAFTVGVVRRLERKFGLKFHRVAGTSTGALIAPFASSDRMLEAQRLYLDFDSQTLISALGPAAAVQTGHLHDLANLKVALEANITQPIADRVLNSTGRMFLTTANLNTGQLVYYFAGGGPEAPVVRRDARAKRITNRARLVEAAFASAMQPVLMPTVPIGGHEYIDGGIRETVPTRVLLDNGATHVFSIGLTAEKEQFDPNLTDLIQRLQRVIDIFSSEVIFNDIAFVDQVARTADFQRRAVEKLKVIAPGYTAEIDDVFADPSNPVSGFDIQALFTIRPKKKLIDDSLKFTRRDMRRMMRLGRDRADDMFLTVQEAAPELGITDATLRNRLREGRASQAFKSTSGKWVVPQAQLGDLGA